MLDKFKVQCHSCVAYPNEPLFLWGSITFFLFVVSDQAVNKKGQHHTVKKVWISAPQLTSCGALGKLLRFSECKKNPWCVKRIVQIISKATVSYKSLLFSDSMLLGRPVAVSFGDQDFRWNSSHLGASNLFEEITWNFDA